LDCGKNQKHSWKRRKQEINEGYYAFSVADAALLKVSCAEECSCQSAKPAGAGLAVVAATAA